MAPGAGTTSAEKMKLSKRLFPLLAVAPLRVTRTYATCAPSRPEVEKVVAVPAGFPLALKLDWIAEFDPIALQATPSTLYSKTWLVKPVPVRWVA